jgi:hypothetical protein
MFQKIEDAAVLLFHQGVFSVHDVYVGQFDTLYAKRNHGFIYLSKGGETSVTKTRWQHIEGVLYNEDGPFGRLRRAVPKPIRKGNRSR